MLLNGGEHDNVRLLSPKTVELMTQNHVGALFNEGKTGFGLGFEILEDPGKGRRHRIAGRVLVGRRVAHRLLGGSEREARGGAHDAAAAGHRQ
jgi:hypothetical protein